MPVSPPRFFSFAIGSNSLCKLCCECWVLVFLITQHLNELSPSDLRTFATHKSWYPLLSPSAFPERPPGSRPPTKRRELAQRNRFSFSLFFPSEGVPRGRDFKLLYFQSLLTWLIACICSTFRGRCFFFLLVNDWTLLESPRRLPVTFI